MRAYRKWETLETGRYNAKSGGHFSYLRVKIVNFDHSLTRSLFGTQQKCDIYRTFFSLKAALFIFCLELYSAPNKNVTYIVDFSGFKSKIS